MALLENSLRPFWVPNLNEVSGVVQKGLRAWLTSGNYQFYSPVEPESFTLNLAETGEFLPSIAADINRFASAAFESVSQAGQNPELPRSTAWLIIKSYYAAFFSAHAIMRMFGEGVIQIDGDVVGHVNEIGEVFGAVGKCAVTRGPYRFAYESTAKEVIFRRLASAKGGAHEAFWTVFYKWVRGLSYDVLRSPGATTIENQNVSAKLGELCESLTYSGSNGGTWLPVVRNEVNYRHQRGTWFPYSSEKAVAIRLFNARRFWRSDPMSISMAEGSEGTLGLFQNTCSFLIALCRSLVLDMASRCPEGRSFCAYGSLALLNHLSR